MSNPPRAKGTRGENWGADKLRPVFPNIERAPLKGVHDHGDYVNVGGWCIEMKNTRKPLFLAWVRNCRAKATHGKWAILWKGDGRTEDGQPLVVMSLPTFLDLVQAANESADGALAS